MKGWQTLWAGAALLAALSGCGGAAALSGEAARPQEAAALMEAAPQSAAEPAQESQEETQMLMLQIGDAALTAAFEDNTSAEAFRALLAEGPLTLSLRDYANFEKVGPLGVSLPRNDTRITTTPGDIILYQGNQITIYYDVNSWSFTRLARIQDTTQEQLKAILGSGDVTVTFSLTEG